MAYAFHKLHSSQVIESVVETSLQYSKMYIDHARNFIRQKPSDSVSFLCGNAGIYAVSAVINQSHGNLQAVQEDLNQFKKGATVCLRTSFNRQGNDEMLFGRAGYLSGIYWLNTQLPLQQRFPTHIASNIAEITILTGNNYAHKVGSAGSMPLLWVCYGERYLGAAHGVASILHMLLESPMFASHLLNMDHKMVQPTNSTQQLVQSAIDNLLRLQTEDGNFPTILEDQRHQKSPASNLVHWLVTLNGFLICLKKYFVLPGVLVLQGSYLFSQKRISFSRSRGTLIAA